MSPSIALLHYTAPPVIGGVESVIGAQARALASAGHGVRVLAGRGGSPGRDIAFIPVPLADSQHPRIRAITASLDAGVVPDAFAPAVQEIATSLRDALTGVDVLIAHNIGSLPLNLPLTAAVHRLGVGGPAVVLWHHDVAAAMPRYRSLLARGQPWDLVSRAWPGAINVAVSQARAEAFADASGLSLALIRVVPNGIDLDRALALSSGTRRLLERLDLRAAGPILLAPARVTPRKNLTLGIRVLAELRSRGLDARLIMTGALDPHDRTSKAHRRDLAELAEWLGAGDAVHGIAEHLGRPGGNRLVADLYRVADALFLPSTDEGFGLPILEAGAVRLPVICADIPALRELAGGDGTYFDPAGSPSEIASLVLSRLASDPGHRLSARIRAGYSWPEVCRRWLDPIVAELTAPRHDGPGSPADAPSMPPPGLRAKALAALER